MTDTLPLRPVRGGFLRPFGCGEFIRAFLSGQGPHDSPVIDPVRGAPTEDIRSTYKEALLRAHAEDMVAVALGKGIELSLEEALRRIPHRLTKVRSYSFYRYFHLLKQLGWVEATGEEEASLPGGVPGARVEHAPRGTTLVEVPQPRRFYRLTATGKKASDEAWSDPLQALYGYPREYRSGQGTRLARPGSLPRSARARPQGSPQVAPGERPTAQMPYSLPAAGPASSRAGYELISSFSSTQTAYVKSYSCSLKATQATRTLPTQ